MSLSDCIHCWCNPCECGYDYENWSVKRLEKQISMLQDVLKKKKRKRKKDG